MYVMDAIYTGSTYWTSHAVENSNFEVTSMTYYTYNPETWDVLNEQVGDKSLQFVTSAWVAPDEMAYCTYGSAGKSFGCFDTEYGQLIGLGTVAERLTAMAATADGALYGIDATGNLVEINTTTGKNIKVIGNTGLNSYWRTSAAIDSEAGIMYYIDCGSSVSSMYAVDIETAVATKLYDFSNSEQVIGLYVAEDNTPATVPGAPSDAALEFTEGSLEGFVTFTAPTTFYDGSTGSGDLTYSIVIDDNAPLTGEATWGSVCRVPVSFDASGNHTFVISMHNTTGDGPSVRLQGFIGTDVPAAVTSASAAYSNGAFTVKWTAPTEGANGGPLNAADLRYDVVRTPDNVKVADHITATTITDPLEEPCGSLISYQYIITPYIGELAGESVTTSKKSIGYFLPPYENNLESSAAITGYTVLDANKDGKKWAYNSSSKALRIQYSSSLAMDDWFFTPQLELKAGYTYTFSINAHAHNNTDHEIVEAAISTGTTVATVVETIIQPTELVSKEDVTLSGTFTPTETKRYRLGVHAMSPKNTYYLYVTKIAVSAGASGATPGTVTDFTVTPASDGALAATISLKAPTVDGMGDPLTSLTKIELSRGEELLTTFENPAPGAVLSYVDDEAPARNVTYTATAYNASGAGAPITATAFIGYDVPKPVSELAVRLGENSGEAVISWSAPASDMHDTPLSASALKYTVVRHQGEVTTPVVTNTTETSVTDQALLADDPQEFVSYSVVAITSGGESASVESNLIPLGMPHAVPFAESFKNGRISSEWGLESSNPAAGWLLAQDGSVDGVFAEDDDNGFAIMQGMTANSWATLYTGAIAIPDEGTPVLSLAYYHYDARNTLEISIAETGTYDMTSLKTVTMNIPSGEGWSTVTVDLSAYKGKSVQLFFKATIVSATVVMIDNIRIENRVDKDLSIRSLSLPGRVAPGTDYYVVIVYENKGLTKADNYTISLLENDKVIGTYPGEALEPGQATYVYFERNTPVTVGNTVSYKGQITYTGDEDEANNTSDVYVVKVISPEAPAPQNATGKKTDNTVTLSWNEPDLTVTAMEPVTDSAEDYTPFSSGLANTEVFDDYVGDWTMYDNDGTTPYDITVSGESITYPNCHRPVGFMIIPDNGFGTAGWDAHTGSQSFVSFASQYSANDDWMISPLLSGDAQTVSFFARSVTLAYGAESFEVFASQTDTRITSFSRVLSVAETPADWTEYKVELPEGTRYFAIRCVSNQAFALLVDDVTFVPAHPYAQLELIGYNIYRDGEKRNIMPVPDKEFTDINVPAGEHTYSISAVYNRGESKAESAVITTSGITGAEEAKSISGAKGTIIAKGYNGSEITVITASGMIVAAEVCNSDAYSIALEPGIYMVICEGTTSKVVVK